MPGADGVSVTTFAHGLGPRLRRLSRLIASDQYRPQPLRPVIASRGGKQRERGIPTVCDRIVQRAFLSVTQRTLRGRAADVSFAYHRGRSWLDALACAARCRDDGLRWVFRTDITDFFAAVDHGLLHRVVSDVFGDPRVARIVIDWARAPVLTASGVARRPRGLPEGAPISPALANLFLRGFDEQVHGRHGRLVRFADDLALFCSDLDTAVAGAKDVSSRLESLGLALNPGKTYISSFDAGFTMLGWRFRGEHGEPVRTTPGWTHPLTAPQAS